MSSSLHGRLGRHPPRRRWCGAPEVRAPLGWRWPGIFCTGTDLEASAAAQGGPAASHWRRAWGGGFGVLGGGKSNAPGPDLRVDGLPRPFILVVAHLCVAPVGRRRRQLRDAREGRPWAGARRLNAGEAADRCAATVCEVWSCFAAAAAARTDKEVVAVAAAASTAASNKRGRGCFGRWQICGIGGVAMWGRYSRLESTCGNWPRLDEALWRRST